MLMKEQNGITNLFSKSAKWFCPLVFHICFLLPIIVDLWFVLILDQMKTSEKMKKEKMGVFKVLEESSESNAECVF